MDESMAAESWKRVSHMVGEPVVDKENRRIGRVENIAADADDGLPTAEWLVVRTSLFGRRRLIPVEKLTETDRTIHVPFSKELVLLSPVPDIPMTVHRSEREALMRHYMNAA